MTTPEAPFPDGLVLEPVSRWPTTLLEDTRRTILDASVGERVRRASRTGETPTISIVMVTYNGLLFTRLCLESLLAMESDADFEVIVVDNASQDGTAAYLLEAAAMDARLEVRLNAVNTGFGAATNQGLALARGEVLVLLNNDTIVCEGWLEGIRGHLADSHIGLVGAATNRAGNEAEIEVPYRTYGELRAFARGRRESELGRIFDIRTATMFCVGLRRETWERIGPLDERFEVGLFEDDDYSMRARQEGYRVVCADDVFVHHFGQASIGELGRTGDYGPLFRANRARWEAKWGIEWKPYDRREKPTYRDLVERIRQVVSETVPADATVAVLNKGDAQLLDLGGRAAWHFPRGEDGAYAGHYPVDSTECIGHLEALRDAGASHFVVPDTMRWWLDHYVDFRRHLSEHHRLLHEDDACVVFALSGGGVGA